jgi:hypothetical protein
MKITIIVPDKTVLVDGRPAILASLDWTPFAGNPSTPWDDIHAVQFDTNEGAGHVEYALVQTSPPVRPNIKPGNWLISQADFDARFAWVLPAYDEARAREDAALAADEAARTVSAEQAVGTAPFVEIPANLVTREEAESFARAAADRAVADFAKRLAAETGGV